MPARPRTAAAAKAASKSAAPATPPVKKAAAKPPAKPRTKASTAGAAAVADAARTIVGAEHLGLRDLPLGTVIPSPDNPRTVLEDLDTLARSIQQRGVLEPIVVTARADGDGYDLVMGHRRHAAAALAGLKTIPAIVRPAGAADVADREALIDRMVENLQRHDLAVVDEARGFARLKSLGLTQDAIAKAVGRNPGHVSKYLRLLSLPEPLQARIGAPGGISIEQAVDVARLPGEVQVAIADATHAGDDARWAGPMFDSTVRQVAGRAKRDLERAEAVARARKSKTVLLNVDGDEISPPPSMDRVNGPAPLSWIYPQHGPDWQQQWTAHAKLPCHAAFVRSHPEGGDDAVRAWIGFVCTDPASHTVDDADAGDSPSSTTHVPAPRGVGAAIAAPVDPQREAHREAAAAAMTARRLFVTNLFGGKLPAASAVGHVLGGQLRDELLGAEYYDAPDLAIAADFLGIAGAADVATLADVIAAAAAATRLTGDQLLRWALAVRLSTEEAKATALLAYPRRGDIGDAVIVKAYLEFLEASGHELHPLERDLVFDGDLTVEAALIDLELLEPAVEEAVETVSVEEAHRANGVTDDALASAVIAGVPAAVWLRGGVKVPTGRCRACGGDAKALTGGRAGKHKAAAGEHDVPAGSVCPGGGQPLLTLAEVRASEPADGVDLETCPTCQGVGRVGDRDELCGDCAGRGLVAPAPVAAAG